MSVISASPGESSATLSNGNMENRNVLPLKNRRRPMRRQYPEAGAISRIFMAGSSVA